MLDAYTLTLNVMQKHSIDRSIMACFCEKGHISMLKSHSLGTDLVLYR